MPRCDIGLILNSESKVSVGAALFPRTGCLRGVEILCFYWSLEFFDEKYTMLASRKSYLM